LEPRPLASSLDLEAVLESGKNTVAVLSEGEESNTYNKSQNRDFSPAKGVNHMVHTKGGIEMAL
jgi:hypothetical protein